MKRLLSVLLVVSLAGSVAAQEPNVLRTYDLRSILPSFDAESSWRQPLDVRFFDPRVDGFPETSLHGLHARPGADAVVEILTMAVGEELRYEGRQFVLDGESRLVVLAPEEVHARDRKSVV